MLSTVRWHLRITLNHSPVPDLHLYKFKEGSGKEMGKDREKDRKRKEERREEGRKETVGLDDF